MRSTQYIEVKSVLGKTRYLGTSSEFQVQNLGIEIERGDGKMYLDGVFCLALSGEDIEVMSLLATPFTTNNTYKFIYQYL